MGIVNINDDSFSGDGSLDSQACLRRAAQFLSEGADVIDIGAESARTNRAAISVTDEIARLESFIGEFSRLASGIEPIDNEQVWPPLLSVNTWRSEVVEAILPLGVDILNDISGLPTPRNAELCARHGAALLAMHSVGEPKVPHTEQTWPDVMTELDRFFEAKLAVCRQAGLPENRVILDPGIDFAKQRDDNLRIYANLDRLQRFGRPILLPVSRKTVIGEVLGIDDPAERDAGTVACIAAGMRAGAQIFRVHNVDACVKTVKTLWPLLSATTPAAAEDWSR